MIKKILTLLAIALTLEVAHANETDNSSVPGVFAMGNGNLCVYGTEADIIQAFGPPYSAPSMFSLHATGIDRVRSKRILQTAVWEHELFKGLRKVGKYTDFVSYEGDTFIRQMHNRDTVEYIVEFKFQDPTFDPQLTVQPIESPVDLPKLRGNYQIEIAPNVPFFFYYKSSKGYYYRFLVTGAAEVIPTSVDHKKFTLHLLPGESTLMLVSGESREDLLSNLQIIENNTVAALQSMTEKVWRNRSAVLKKISAVNLSKQERKKFAQAIDDISVLIKAQQGKQGGVLAGTNYHMAYVRDQYGAYRGMLALGHYDDARDMLNYYYNIWKDNGFVANAQAIGYKGIFHPHENDESEITGYLVVQAFDYYYKTKDAEFIKKILPMLEWATDAQQKHLIDGMMPFNGDETYIAGGIIPRKVMYNGSAEATLLFIEGSYRLLDFVREQGLWDQNQISQLSAVVENCSNKYRSNFYRDGKLYINNPSRELKQEYPAVRPGICLYPGPIDHHLKTYHFRGPLYFCERCMKKDTSNIQIPEPELFIIPSGYLFPFYINARLFTPEEKDSLLQTVIDQYKATGKISNVDYILGYDYGLFLYALVSTGNKLSDEVYKKMMSLRDNTGAWVEYYMDGLPNRTPCRPWESGINIEAAIKYAGMQW